MKTYMLKCPQCGGNLEIEENMELFYCKFCGTKISMDRISKSEMRIKEIEHEEKMRDADYKENKMMYVILVLLIFTMIVFGLLSIFSK